jgi:hypothetical protein
VSKYNKFGTRAFTRNFVLYQLTNSYKRAFLKNEKLAARQPEGRPFRNFQSGTILRNV